MLGSLRASLSARSYSAFNHPRFGTLYGAHVLKGDGGFESGLLRQRVCLSWVPRTLSAKVAAQAPVWALLRDVRTGQAGDEQTQCGTLSLSGNDAVPVRESSDRSQRRAGRGLRHISEL